MRSLQTGVLRSAEYHSWLFEVKACRFRTQPERHFVGRALADRSACRLGHFLERFARQRSAGRRNCRSHTGAGAVATTTCPAALAAAIAAIDASADHMAAHQTKQAERRQRNEKPSHGIHPFPATVK